MKAKLGTHWSEMCQHTDRRLTRVVKTWNATGQRDPENVEIREQCVECGVSIRAHRKISTPNWRELPEFDGALRERVAEERRSGAFVPAPSQKPQYEEYLHSTEWRSKRALVLKRSSGECEGCGLSRATQVHHITYARLGNEMLFDLVAVCDECHERIHHGGHE